MDNTGTSKTSLEGVSGRWVKPEPVSAFIWPLWNEILNQKYFSIYARSVPVLDPFQLVLKDNILIAVAETKEDILKRFKAIEEVLEPSIPPHEVAQFVRGKITAWILDQEAKELVKAKERRRQRRLSNGDKIVIPKSSQQAFKQFHLENEKLIAVYEGMLWENPLPRAVDVFVTLNYICISGADPLLFRSVVSISRRNFTGFEAVRFETAKRDYLISCLTKTVELFVITNQLWMRTIECIEKTNLVSKAENDKIRFNEEVDLDGIKTQVNEILSKESLTNNFQLQNFCTLFNLPSETEKIQEEFLSKLSKNEVDLGDGQMFISTSFLCYWSGGVDMKLTGQAKQVIIPFSHIRKIKKRSTEMAQEYAQFGRLDILPNQIIIETEKDSFVMELVNRSAMYSALFEAITTYKKSGIKCALDPSITDCTEREIRFDPNIIHDPNHFGKDFLIHEKKRKLNLEKYFSSHGRDVPMIRNHELNELIKQGIPLRYKAPMWMILSGAAAHMTANPDDYYSNLVKTMHLKQDGKLESDDKTRIVMEQIEKDIDRSLDQPFSKSPKGLSSLRNVLFAYAAHNPTVGYCQSMNIVTGTLLLFASEEEAFYLLCSIISRVPQYYIAEMTGSVVDMIIFADLLKQHAPEVDAHLHAIGVEVSIFALSWFLCFFVTSVPWEVSLRVMDCFFAFGSIVFLQVGLALLVHSKDQILRFKDVVSLTDFLNKTTFETDTLIKLAFENLVLDPKKIDQLRNIHKLKTIQNSSQQTNKQILLAIKQKTKFTMRDIESLHSQFKSLLPVDSISNALKKREIESLFLSKVTFWPQNRFKPIKHWFFKKDEIEISFSTFMLTLDAILHDFKEKQRLVFDAFCQKDQGRRFLLNNSELESGIFLLFQLERGGFQEREDFADKWSEMISNHPLENEISFEEFEKLTDDMPKA